MTVESEVSWRVEFLASRVQAPRSALPDEVSACTHEVATALVDLGGATSAENARLVLAGVCETWPDGHRPDPVALSKEAVWVTRAPKAEDCVLNGKLDPLASRIEDAIAGKLVSVGWPWITVGNLTQALMPGSITMIVGTPGASKSFLLLQAALHWIKEGWPVALYELEENNAFWLGRALAQLAECGPLTDPAWIAEHADVSRAHLHQHSSVLKNLAGHMTTAPEKGITLEGLADWVEQQAKANRRIIMADPLTAATESGRPWEAAQKFMMRAKRAAVDKGCSLIFTTHGKKRSEMAKGPPDLDSLAGGSAYARFASCVLWLEAPAEPAWEMVMNTNGQDIQAFINRRLRILKAREGRGTGVSIGCEFRSDSLTLVEHGVVIKKQQAQPADASHQRARLKQSPNASEDLFREDA